MCSAGPLRLWICGWPIKWKMDEFIQEFSWAIRCGKRIGRVRGVLICLWRRRVFGGRQIFFISFQHHIYLLMPPGITCCRWTEIYILWSCQRTRTWFAPEPTFQNTFQQNEVEKFINMRRGLLSFGSKLHVNRIWIVVKYCNLKYDSEHTTSPCS